MMSVEGRGVEVIFDLRPTIHSEKCVGHPIPHNLFRMFDSSYQSGIAFALCCERRDQRNALTFQKFVGPHGGGPLRPYEISSSCR